MAPIGRRLVTLVPRPGCKKCGAAPVDDPEAAGWGDGGTICPSCRAIRNARARASATRIVAHASIDIASRHPGGKLATVRRLPGMETLRSIPFWGSDPATLSDSLDDVWREVGDGLYLVSVGSPGSEPSYFAVEVESGRMVEQQRLAPDEVQRLPGVIAELLAEAQE